MSVLSSLARLVAADDAVPSTAPPRETPAARTPDEIRSNIAALDLAIRHEEASSLTAQRRRNEIHVEIGRLRTNARLGADVGAEIERLRTERATCDREVSEVRASLADAGQRLETLRLELQQTEVGLERAAVIKLATEHLAVATRLDAALAGEPQALLRQFIELDRELAVRSSKRVLAGANFQQLPGRLETCLSRWVFGAMPADFGGSALRLDLTLSFIKGRAVPDASFSALSLGTSVIARLASTTIPTAAPVEEDEEVVPDAEEKDEDIA